MKNKTVTLSGEHVDRLIERLSKAQMFKEVTELRAALAEPVPPTDTKCAICGQGASGCAEGCHYMEAGNGEPVPPAGGVPDPIIGVLKANLADGVNPMFSGGDLKHLIRLLEEGTRLQAEVERLQSLNVQNILIEVTPGFDGMGHERYAQSVDDVNRALGDLGESNENLQSELVKARELLGRILKTGVLSFEGEPSQEQTQLECDVCSYLANQSAPSAKDWHCNTCSKLNGSSYCDCEQE